MAEPSTNKVTVRVEVVVEGVAGAPSVTVGKETQGKLKPPFRAIVSPQPYPPSRTPVVRSGGVNYVGANGGSQVINGQFPRRVCALAFWRLDFSANFSANYFCIVSLILN